MDDLVVWKKYTVIESAAREGELIVEKHCDKAIIYLHPASSLKCYSPFFIGLAAVTAGESQNINQDNSLFK